MVDTPADLNPSTAEIPSSVPSTASAASAPSPTTPGVSRMDNPDLKVFAPQPTQDNNQAEIARYEAEQSGMPQPGSGGISNMPQFLSEDSVTSPIGFELREARRKLSSGEEADGLLIIDIKKGSPAEQCGLQPYRHGTHDVLTGAAIAGAMIFPPAIAIVPILDYTQLGESYDMIIGVDGSRVSNFLDFQDRTHDLQPGEILYLSVVRNGRRVQVPVPVPPNISSLTY
jgi:hypothetical protein